MTPADAIVTVDVMCTSTGRVRPKGGTSGVRRYLPGGWSDATLPVNVFLVRHREGLCLFDTGQVADATRRGHFPRWYPFFRLARFELERHDEVGAWLQTLGVAAGLRWVVLSHLHTDHAGGLAAVRDAEVLVSRVEFQRASGLGGRVRGYLPQYWPAGLRPRLVDFDGPPLGPFAGSLPLTSDGALTLVPIPGHTPGHMGMLVAGRFLLAGDASETAEELAYVHPRLAGYCRAEGITVLTTHDRDAPALLEGHR